MTSDTTIPFQTNPPKTFVGLITLILRVDILGVSAAIAFYTVLSLTPIVIVCFSILSLLGLHNFGEFESTLHDAMGSSADLALQAVRHRFELQQRAHYGIGIIGIVSMLVSGSGVISEIQSALNNVFLCRNIHRTSNTKRDILFWIRGKALSLLVLSLWIFILAVSLVFSMTVNLIPQLHDLSWFRILSGAASFIITALLFAFMFQYLPSKRRAFSLSFVMGLICSAFFQVGRWGLLFYFKFVNVETYYGALGSAIVLLIWAYYNGIMIMFTACLSQLFLAEHFVGKKST